MSKKISGAEYPVAKIFSSDSTTFPTYQRPRAWTPVLTAELFSTVTP